MTPLELTLAAFLALPAYHEDTDSHERARIALAVSEQVALTDPPTGVSAEDWHALELAVGAAETHYAARIVLRGECLPHECDHGRARSPWQLHKNAFTAPVWAQLGAGISGIAVQVDAADKMLKRAFYLCRRSGEPFPASTILAFAGRGCRQKTIEPWKGLDLRLEYFRRARQAMRGKPA